MAAEAASLQVEPVTNVQDPCATEFTSHEPQEQCTASTIGDITRTASQKSKINFSSLGWKQILKTSIWHGGTWFDAWITAVAAQVGYHALISTALSSLQLSCTIFLSSRARLKETLGYFSQPWIFQLRSFCPVSRRLYELALWIKVQFLRHWDW